MLDFEMFAGYPAMGFFLNQTGRPMLYSCSWPAYIVGNKITVRKKVHLDVTFRKYTVFECWFVS